MIKLLFLLTFSVSAEVPQDSVGMETINGKVFVIHKVEEKETLFAISRRYRTTVDAIVQYNPAAATSLEIGQLLKVPYVAPVVNKPGTVVHKVEPKETLYSIARNYNVTIEQLKEWNNLTDNALRTGQELVVRKSESQPGNYTRVSNPTPTVPQAVSRSGVHTVQQKETLYSIARQYGVTVEEIKSWNNMTGNDLAVGAILFVAQPEKSTVPANTKVTPPVETRSGETVALQTPKTEPLPAKEKETPSKREEPSRPEVKEQPQTTIHISESVQNSDEIVEGGLAELIEGTEGNRKYLALHRTAPMGTILKVKNQMNNREVFVRVMGKLPDTALTDKLIIRISRSAYDRLGAIDPRFRVEVTYYK